jgi:hypothetical protein
MDGDDLKLGFLPSFIAQAEEEIESLSNLTECAAEVESLQRVLKAIKTEERNQAGQTVGKIRHLRLEGCSYHP